MPWQVTLFKLATSKFCNRNCGGTLVSSVKVITAAHCFDSKYADPSQWKIKAGHVQMSANDENVQIRDVKAIYIHE